MGSLARHWVAGYRISKPICSALLQSRAGVTTGASQVVLVIKNLPANAGDVGGAGSIPGSERSPAEGNGNPLQCFCLEIPMDRGTWQAIVHGVAKYWT